MAVIQLGNIFKIMDFTGSTSKLPLGIYSLNFNVRDNEYYLTKQLDFKLPEKVYGKHDIINRWLKSYKHNSHKNMGIILSGIKGSGKTITAQKFCIESGMPVILINEPFKGSDFINYLVKPELGECIIFIDEFEKVYQQKDDNYNDNNKARDLLTLMDGSYQTKLIFLLTVNSFNLNEYFINRLNRIKYRKDYIDLEESVMNEIIDDLLINKEHKDSIKIFFERINICTFDLLVNLIKEMNLFEEDALEVGKHLNLRSEPKKYWVTELFDGKEYKCSDIKLAFDNPDIEICRYDINYFPKNEEGENEHDYNISFRLDDAEIEKLSNNSFMLRYNGYTFKFIQITTLSLFF